MAEVAEGVDVDTAVTREEAGTLAVQGDAAYSPECVEGRSSRNFGRRGFQEVRVFAFACAGLVAFLPSSHLG